MLSKDYNFHFEKAELFYEKGDYNSALLEFERIFAYKDTTDVLNYIGCCYMHLKKLDKAEDVFLFLKKNCPEWETPWFNLGRVYIKRGEYKKAEALIKKALKINPHSSDANFYMGLCYEKSGCFKKAICFYNISTSLESCVECHLRLSCCYQVLGEDDLMFDEAIKAYNVNKYDNDAVYNLTRILIKRKRYTEAYEILNNDVFICSSDLGILKNLLFSSIKVREFKMAESIAKYLIELDSDNSLAIDFLGQCQSADSSMIDKK